MPSNSAPRKAYRPRSIDPDPMGLAMTQVALLLPQQKDPLIATCKEAIHRMQFGGADQKDWGALADSLNVAEMLCTMAIASDHLETFANGLQALANVWLRHKTNHSWTLRGPELTAIDDALFVHYIQLNHCSQGEMAKALAAVRRKSQQARAGNVGPGVTVFGV